MAFQFLRNVYLVSFPVVFPWSRYSDSEHAKLPAPAAHTGIQSFKLSVPFTSALTIHFIVKGKGTLTIRFSTAYLKIMCILGLEKWRKLGLKIIGTGNIKYSLATKRSKRGGTPIIKRSDGARNQPKERCRLESLVEKRMESPTQGEGAIAGCSMRVCTLCSRTK